MGCLAKLKSSSWAYPTAVLSLYGFFANCRVAEPFLTPYLIGPHKNISGEVVSMAHTYCYVCRVTLQLAFLKYCIFYQELLSETNCFFVLIDAEICMP